MRIKKPISVDFKNHAIIVTREFQKLASDVRSEEYATLQRVRNDYPEYSVGTRSIKKNPNKRIFKHLTYEYIEKYIRTHGTEAEIINNLTTLAKYYQISKCHKSGVGYATIKSWFLETYPEVKDFKILDTEEPIEEIENNEAVA